MLEIASYKLSFLPGTFPYVLQELSTKYPDIKIEKQNNTEILFESEINDIDAFKNLYSPTHISDNQGNDLNLSKREWRKAYTPAGINPSLAYIMCQVAELSEEDIVADPFCGASTIPITAIKYFNVKRCICSDISGKAIEKSLINFESAGIDKSSYKLIRSDINKITLNKKNIDKIISNLPFGIRVGTHESNILAYEGLEKYADKLLRTKGKLIILTQEKKLVRDTFKKDDWKIKSVAQINEGGLLPEIFLITRK